MLILRTSLVGLLLTAPVLSLLGACSSFEAVAGSPDAEPVSPTTPQDAAVVETSTGDASLLDASLLDAAPTVDAAPDASDGPCGTSLACTRYVFVTSATHNGNFIDQDGADAICVAAAAASAGGKLANRTFSAWLSSTTKNASSRLRHGTKPYRRVDDVQIAADWNALTSTALSAPISVTEQGLPLTGAELAWTGGNASGFYDVADCTGWSSPTGVGTVGQIGATSGTWSSVATNADCATAKHLYCFEN